MRASLSAFFPATLSATASPSRVVASRYLPSYMSSIAIERSADALAGDSSARSKVARAFATSPARTSTKPYSWLMFGVSSHDGSSSNARS